MLNGLETPSEDAHACYHCGEAVAEHAPWRVEIDEQPRRFCCPGCAAVANAIIEGGLAGYYRLRTALPERPRQRQDIHVEQWALFDDPALQARFVSGDDQRVHTTLAVEGITCAACAWLIEHRLNALEGVVGSAVNLTHHRLRLEWDPQRIALSRLLAELAAIGYPCRPFEPDEAQRRLKHESRRQLRRLIVAALGMMQALMFSLPFYLSGDAGLDADFDQLFHWLALAMTTPVVLYAAQPFFHQAWRDLRTRTLGMDVPVSLAIGSAYLASAWAVVNGQGEVYFDSVSMFIFFLLFGRHLEARARQRGGAAGNALTNLLPMSAMRLDANDEPRLLPASELDVDDRVLVKPGHAVPADGVIENGTSSLDESALTGEPEAVKRSIGDAVTGGSHNLENPLTLRITRTGRDTRVAGILDLTDRAFASRPRIAHKSARLAHHFVLQVLLIAAAVALGWWFIAPERAFWVTLSVLVVTCPCALALATPTALTAAHGQLQRRGALLTRADALETLAGIDRVIFDKTGTLTSGEMRLLDTRALTDRAPQDLRAIAASLEAHSEHPIARAFHTHRRPDVRATEVNRQAGEGLEGHVAGAHWRLGRPEFAAHRPPAPPDDGHWLLLTENGQPRAWFALGDRLREEATTCLATLQRAGIAVELLSGDTTPRVRELAVHLGIDDWQASLRPEDKLARVRHHQARGERVAMVGDGINDVPVLAGADVAFAMNEATDLARTHADIVLLTSRLQRVTEALAVARATQRIIRQNLGWALLYNLAALPLAACGLVPPWLAAIGMSLSSLVVVGNALRLAHPTRFLHLSPAVTS